MLKFNEVVKLTTQNKINLSNHREQLIEEYIDKEINNSLILGRFYAKIYSTDISEIDTNLTSDEIGLFLKYFGNKYSNEGYKIKYEYIFSLYPNVIIICWD